MNTYRGFSTRQTPQSQPIPGSNQVANSAGGFAWQVDEWQLLDRFLILGTEGGTYYIKEQELTRESAENVMKCIASDGPRTVARIVEISDSGRAMRNDPAIFALALCRSFGDDATRKAAYAALPKVCRIGTHLFHFAEFCQQFKGWSRGLRTAVSKWYEDQIYEHLALDLVKYRSRDGWSHADMIKLAHVGYGSEPSVPSKSPLYDWVMRGKPGHEEAPTPNVRVIEGYERVQHPELKPAEVASLIREYRLPREAVLPEHLNSLEVWSALLDDMPPEAMIRNLATMGGVGLLKPLSEANKKVIDALGDVNRLRRARIHPVRVLAASLMYQKGTNRHNTWAAVPQILDALEAAYYECFASIEPTGKATMLALDISGSMSSPLMSMDYMTCAQGTAAMAMVTARTEPNYFIGGFSHEFVSLGITAQTRLADAFRQVQDHNFGSTDCSLPMKFAQANKLDVHTFVVYTDSETWAGTPHPAQALRQYREAVGHDAKLIVVGMQANKFTIADPHDAGMLDVVGFDTNTPQAIAEFSR